MEDSESIPTSDLVEELLAEIVARPDAEQEAALAALQGAHPELAEELGRRFSLFRHLVDSAAPETGDAGSRRFGEFELVAELGHGGMGVVYLARQQRGGQERQVALKLVRDRGLFSPQARERLRREGAAAFRLDHPAICPVLDVGEVEGTPYLALRYVPGETLAQRIASSRGAGTPLALPADTVLDGSTATTASHGSSDGDRIRAIVAMGEQIARALHFAHEAGLVHRDVKPGNVMVTPEGAPVLLDFGLVLDESQDSLTLTGQPLGTPAYMSPEQISPKGRPPDRTTDVYSLGATLYEALALRPPFEAGTREELYRKILTDDPQDLRRSVHGVSRDLQVVLETALDKDPARRYATALALAEDLRRVRSAQPILARPPGVARRLSLWVQRNRLAAAILALLLVSQGAIVALAIGSERRAEEARRARVRAVAHFQSARDAVDELVRTAEEHLVDVPWLEPVRRELFEKALEFHRDFLAERGDDPDLRMDAAVAQRDSAALLAQLGDYDAADRLLVDAKATLEALDTDAANRALARAHFVTALVASGRGEPSRAEQEYRAAVGRWRTAVQQRPEAADERRSLGQGLRRLGDVLDKTGSSEARTFVDEALSVLDRPNQRLELERAAALGLSARMHRNAGEFGPSSEQYERAAELLRSWLKERPRDRRALLLLGNNQLSLGRLHRMQRRYEDAQAACEEARDRFQALARSFPEMLVPRANLASSLNNLANLARRMGKEEESANQLMRSIELQEELVRDFPQMPDLRHGLAGSLYNLGNRLRRRDPEEATRLYRVALEHVEALLESQPETVAFLDIGGRTARNLGTILAEHGQDDEAAEILSRGSELCRELVRRKPNDLRFCRELGIQLFNEGAFLAEAGELDGAAERLREAIEGRAALVARDPSDPRAQRDLIKTWVRLGHVEDLRGSSETLEIWNRGQAAIDGLTKDLRGELQADSGARFDMFLVLHGRGAVLRRAGDPSALESLQRAAAGLATDEREDPGAEVFAESVLCRAQLVALHRAAGDDELAAREASAVNASVARLDLAEIGSRLLRARMAAQLPEIEALLTAYAVDTTRIAALRRALVEGR